MSILTEAEELIHGDRQEAYSHPKVNFATIMHIWRGILKAKAYTLYTQDQIRYEDLKGAYAFIEAMDADDVAMLMIGMKMGREVGNHKRDNLVDIAGYAGTIEMLHNEEEV